MTTPTPTHRVIQNRLEPKQEFWTKSTVKSRGWSDKAIATFLGEPDKTVPNPYYKRSSPMQLFLQSRVLETEKNPEFLKLREKSLKLSAVASKACETKEKNLLEKFETMTIHLKAKPFEVVQANAILAWNEWKEIRNSDRDDSGDFDFERASENSDRDFLDRLMVNYLRHSATRYDDELERLFGKVGKPKAYFILNRKIYEEIMRVFPSLKEECLRQMEDKGCTDEAKF